MPERYTITIKASQVRKGDLVWINDDAFHRRVTSVSSKVKWTTITSELSTKKLENDAIVEVTRERPTAEEAAQAELEGKLFFLDLTEQRAFKDLEDQKRRVTEALANGDWNIASRTQDLLEAKAVHELWARVRQSHLNHATAEQLEPITRLEAYALVLERVREELIDFSRWSSRSTSTWHNAVEDIELDAKSRFLRDAKWNVQL